jgi:hypothetical protein
MSGKGEGRAEGDHQVDLQLGVGLEGLVGHDRAERVRDHQRGLVGGDGVGHRGAHGGPAGRVAEVQVHLTTEGGDQRPHHPVVQSGRAGDPVRSPRAGNRWCLRRGVA